MPKSKRDKNGKVPLAPKANVTHLWSSSAMIALTKAKKKNKDYKLKLIDEVRKCLQQYSNLFVFSVSNMRSSKLGELRCQMRSDSKFFYGKNKVMAIALGRLPEDEVNPNLHLVSKYLSGQCGLLFTNKPEDEVIRFFKTYCELDYTRAGSVATQTVELKAGPLQQFSHAIEPQLRQLGMPTALQKGCVTLLSDFVVCKQSQLFTVEQAKILKLLKIQMAEFRVSLLCMWSRANGKFTELIKKKRTKLKQKERN